MRVLGRLLHVDVYITCMGTGLHNNAPVNSMPHLPHLEHGWGKHGGLVEA